MKKRKDVTNWRNDKKDFIAILGDNKKFLMPAILVLAVVITVVVAVSANHRATEIAATTATEAESATFEIPDAAMEENAYPDVNALVEKYYVASANGDADTLAQIYKGLDETEILKAVAASEYIDDFENITVYTKPGPVEGSYVAYVYNEVKLYEYDGTVPGLETLYICTSDDGSLYINGDIADASELDYLKQINVQADVIDLNNKVASNYNELVSSDEKLAELLTRMRSGLQVSVGEALATAETSTPEESAAEASTEEEAEEVVITTRVIKATDVINIRSSDSETADILDKTTQGQEFKELEALANGWSKIEYKGGVAYVKTEFFEVVSEEKAVVRNENKDEQDTQEEDNAQAAASTEASSTEASASASSTASSAASSASSSSDSGSATKLSNAKTGKMTVTESVRLRKEPSTEADIITTLYGGATVNVVEQYSNGWAKVEYNKNKGYVKAEFLRE